MLHRITKNIAENAHHIFGKLKALAIRIHTCIKLQTGALLMKRTYFILFTTIILSFQASAGVWEERALLERYANQLESLNQSLLIDAQMSADPNARIGLNYPALLRDSQEIVRKIRHHLDSPLEEYRSIQIIVETDKDSTE